MEKIVDARGMACPLPVVEAKKASEQLQEKDVLIMLVDNEVAVQNLMKFATYKNYEVASEKRSDKEFAVRMFITNSVQIKPIVEEEPICIVDGRKQGMVVVLSGDSMGSGDEKLGKALMKAFVFALTKQDQLPETVVCYNKGAYLSCEGSPCLEDLKNLEAEGVKIVTCGTCLEYYKLTPTLQVGSVGNMYEIVEIMEQAKTILRP